MSTSAPSPTFVPTSPMFVPTSAAAPGTPLHYHHHYTAGLTETDIRRIIREELAAVLKELREVSNG